MSSNIDLCCSVCYYDGSLEGEYLIHVRLDNGETEGKNDNPIVRQPIKGSPFQVMSAPLKPVQCEKGL